MNDAALHSHDRSSGLLLHLTSLPTRYGIGDAGENAFRWVELLQHSEQRWWQMLPVGPTGDGTCPYLQTSTFARNPLLISPDQLIADGLIKLGECNHVVFPEQTVDFQTVVHFKEALIQTAWDQFHVRASKELQSAFDEFCNAQREWLDDYALFECLRKRYRTAQFTTWPSELASRDRAALARTRVKSAAQFQLVRFTQFLAFRHFAGLKAYAASHGIALIGDLPFFASPDSCDVWAYPQLFLLDEQRKPLFYSGVPPDNFSSNGQFWGHAVYNWKAARSSGYRWWLLRLRLLLTHVDVIRLDHFRGFAAAWHIPAGARSAMQGEWRPGPGADLIQVFQREFGGLPFIAEDLGHITQDVYDLMNQFRLTGMRVLQFAFDGNPENPFLPANFDQNTVAYTGTHDNDTTQGWFESQPLATQQAVLELLKSDNLHSPDFPPAGRHSEEIAFALMQLIWKSRAAITIAPLQDLLNLGSEARMNVPGGSGNYWGWRCTADIFTDAAFDKLCRLTVETNRNRLE